MPAAGYKGCSKCGVVKALDDFYRDRQNKDGFRGLCKDCDLAARRVRDIAKPEQKRDYNRAYYRANRENLLAKQKEWHWGNRDKILPKLRARYEANREDYIAKQTAREKANPHIPREKELRRRAQKLALPCDDVNLQVVFERDQGVCGICGESADPESWHLDHIIPLSKGGHHTYENVQVSHPSCNLRKGARLPA